MDEHDARHGLPRADDAEQHLIGLVLEFPQATAKLKEVLPLDAMYAERFRAIYNAALNVHSSGMVVDIVTVADRLRRSGELDIAGGESGLMNITEEVVSMAGMYSYARLVAEYWVARETIHWARAVNELAIQTPFPFEKSMRAVNRTAAKIRMAARYLERLLLLCANPTGSAA